MVVIGLTNYWAIIEKISSSLNLISLVFIVPLLLFLIILHIVIVSVHQSVHSAIYSTARPNANLYKVFAYKRGARRGTFKIGPRGPGQR